MTKNILQVVQHLKPGGIETMALDLQHHLGNCHVHIVSLEGRKYKALRDWPRLKTRRTHLHFLNKKPGVRPDTLLKLCHLIKKLKIDAVQTHHIGPLTYGGIAARMMGVKHLVHTEHDAWHLESHKAATLERRLIKWLKPTWVADCRRVAEKLQTLGTGLPPYVIYNGIDTQKFSPVSQEAKMAARADLNLPQGMRLIGCAARLEQVKGLTYLIEAVSHLPKDVYLVLAGNGQDRERLSRQAHLKGCEERVLFLGRVEEMDRFYASLDLFCLPSLNEGFPLSPLEAQACDIPVVISDVGGAGETLCPQTGTLISPGDARALKQALEIKLGDLKKQANPSRFVRTHADVRLMCTAYAKLLAI